LAVVPVVAPTLVFTSPTHGICSPPRVRQTGGLMLRDCRFEIADFRFARAAVCLRQGFGRQGIEAVCLRQGFGRQGIEARLLELGLLGSTVERGWVGEAHLRPRQG
jgi:hypothetical protein